MLPRSTAEHYRSQQRLTVATLAATRRAWAGMGEDFDTSWRTVGPRLTLLVAAAQLGSARNGAAYVPRVLDETDQPDEPQARLNPRGFAGTAADGRDLDGLMYGAVAQARVDVALGSDTSTALARGGRWLDMAVQTAVADAGRQAVQVSVAMRASIGGWVRMTNPPSCSRCAILAGKWFRWNQGFKRHPRCDCVHIPASEDTADEFRTDPQALYDRGLITDLTEAERHALDLGADISQVVNARRGSSGLRGLYTTEGTTRRGIAGARIITGDPGAFIAPRVTPPGSTVRGRQFTRLTSTGRTQTYSYRRAATTRPTPEAIYRFSTSREDAVDLLRRFGYVL